MIRYPIFVFHDQLDFWVFDTRGEHLHNLEGYDIPHYAVVDSEGRILTETADRDALVISDSGAPPDLELLRALLVPALQSKGLYWGANAPIEILVAAAQVACPYDEGGIPVSEMIPRLLQFLHLRKRLPR